MSLIKTTLSLLALSALPYLGNGQPVSTPDGEGFRNLFNGSDLTGWQYRKPAVDSFDGKMQSTDARFSVKNGIFTVNPGKGIKKIWTAEEFGNDFTLKLEFRAAVNADSGIYVRGPQLQCRDYLVAGPYKDLKNYKPQEWNEVIVVVKGQTVVSSTCNGEHLPFGINKAGKKPRTKIPAKGPIGLEADRGQMEYRSIRIKTP